MRILDDKTKEIKKLANDKKLKRRPEIKYPGKKNLDQLIQLLDERKEGDTDNVTVCGDE